MLSRIQEKDTNQEVLELNRMTKKKILDSCKKNKLYHTPALNDVLYLHFQGFDSIENLEEYTGLKCLWLESNAISEIQNLNSQTQLKCLYLHSNLIRKIENLENCIELDTLNLSTNHIRKIENCDSEILPVLTSLNLSSNYLTDYDSLQHLENCKSISVLDLSNNRIDDVLVVKIFAKMPSLRVLVLHGNPVVSKLPQYRKTLILECKELTYLDSRPVFERDRACAEAWKRGGYAEEREENNRWNLKERRKMLDSVNATIRLKNKYRKPDDQISLCSSTDSEKEVQNETDSERKPSLNMEDKMWDEVKNNIQLSDSEKEEEEMKPLSVDVANNPLDEYSKETENSTVVKSESPLSFLYDGRDEMNINIEVSGLEKEKEELNTYSVESEHILSGESKETFDPTVIISEKPSSLFEAGKYEINNNLELLNSENEEEGLNIPLAETEGMLSGESAKEKEIEINLQVDLPFNVQDNIEKDIENNVGRLDSEIEEEIEAENMLLAESSKVTEDSFIVDSKKPCVLLSDEIDASVVEKDKVSLHTSLHETENEITEITEPSLNLQEEMWKEVKNSNNQLDSENGEELMACSVKTEASLNVEDLIWDETENNIELLCSQKQEETITRYSLEINHYQDDESSSSQSTDNSVVSSPFISPIHSDEEQYTSVEINKDKFDLLDLDNKDSSHSEAEDTDDNSSESNERFSVNGSFGDDFETETEAIFDRVQSMFEKSTQDIEDIRNERLKHMELLNEIKPRLDLVKEPTQDPIMEEAISMFSKLNLFGDNEISEKESLQVEDKEEASSVKELNSIDCTGHLYCSCFNDSDSESDSCLDLKETMKNLQKQETELKQLIQKLKEENDKLSEINKIESYLVESFCTEEQESVNAVCGSIVSEIILDLELDKNSIKNYKIFEAQQNDLESESESDIEEASKSMSKVVHDFQQLVQKYKLILKDEDISKEPHSTESPVQSQSNSSWSELINKQYEYIEAKRDRRLQRMVDRVYAQRDKYQDSLEVVDNKLVVVKKDSGKIEELPSAPSELSHLSDSDNENEYFQASDYYKIFPDKELSTGSGDLFEYSSWGLPKQSGNMSDSGSEYESLPDKTSDVCHVEDDLLDKLNMLEITDEPGAGGDAENVTQGISNYAENSNVPLGNEENILLKSLQKSTLSSETTLNATENLQFENISIEDEDGTDHAETKPFTHNFQTVENTFLIQQSATIFEYYGETIKKSTPETSDDVGKITPNVDEEEFDDDFYFKTYTPKTQRDAES